LVVHALDDMIAALGGRSDDAENFFTARLLLLLDHTLRPAVGRVLREYAWFLETFAGSESRGSRWLAQAANAKVARKHADEYRLAFRDTLQGGVLSAALSDFTRARRVSLVASFSEREGANQCEAIHEAFRSVTLG